MADTIDQIEEHFERIMTVRGGPVPPTTTRYDFVYTLVIGGVEHNGAVTDKTVTECTDYIEQMYGVNLGDPTLVWGRGHVDKNGNAVIHPAKNKQAFDRINDLLQQAKARQSRR